MEAYLGRGPTEAWAGESRDRSPDVEAPRIPKAAGAFNQSQVNTANTSMQCKKKLEEEGSAVCAAY